MIWEEKSFTELGFIGRGRSRHRPRNDESLYGGEYPMIQTGEVKAANFYINDFTQTYNEKGLSQSKLWSPNTLCITIAANIAETGILGIEACFPDSIIGFVPYEGKSDVRFIKYYFDIVKLHMQRISQGATQDNLSLEKLLTFKVPTPPLPTQQKIASILSAYDNLIENNLKRIQLLEEAAQQLYKEWFVNFRFPGSEKVSFDKETGLPEGWEKKRADKIFTINIGKTPPRKESHWFSESEGVKWVSISDMNKSEIFIKNTKERIVKDGMEKFNVKKVQKGTVFLSFKLTIGSVGIATEDMASNEAIAHFNIGDDTPSTEYTYLYLKTFPYQTLGSTSSIGKALNSKLVKAIPFIIPSNSVLLDFDKIVKPIFDQIAVLVNKNSVLIEARDLLLPRLMNRAIKV